MLRLAVLVLLQGAVYIAQGDDTPYPFSPSKTDEEIAAYPDLDAVQPIISDPIMAWPKPYYGTNEEREEINQDLPSINNPLLARSQAWSQQLSFPPRNLRDVRSDDERTRDGHPPAEVLTSPSQSFKPSGLSFSEWSYQLSKNGLSLIERFVCHYAEKIKSSKKLRRAFQARRLNATTVSALLYDFVFEAHTIVSNPDAEISAQFIGLAGAVNFNKIAKKDALIRILPVTIANYLLYRGFLTEGNVTKLSQQYFELTERKINAIANPNPEENFKTVFLSFSEFLCILWIANTYSTNMITGVLASQFYA